MTSHNPYRMPFIIPAEVAAQRFIRVIDKGIARTTIPWQMGIVGKIMRALPNWLYDRLAVNAPRKPRQS